MNTVTLTVLFPVLHMSEVIDKAESHLCFWLSKSSFQITSAATCTSVLLPSYQGPQRIRALNRMKTALKCTTTSPSNDLRARVSLSEIATAGEDRSSSLVVLLTLNYLAL
jgi:hypothetical protein